MWGPAYSFLIFYRVSLHSFRGWHLNVILFAKLGESFVLVAKAITFMTFLDFICINVDDYATAIRYKKKKHAPFFLIEPEKRGKRKSWNLQ